MYILQGILIHTIIIAIVEYFTDQFMNRLDTLNVSLLRYISVTLVQSIPQAIVEEFILRYVMYNKLFGYIFSDQMIALGVYLFGTFLFTRWLHLSISVSCIYIVHTCVYIYLYESTGTIVSPIIVNVYGRLFR